MVRGAEQMAAVAEEIVNTCVKGLESLRLMARFETTHLAFLLPRRLVRELRSVVHIWTRIMRRSRQELSGGDGGSELCACSWTECAGTNVNVTMPSRILR